jgi:hypothetical protein
VSQPPPKLEPINSLPAVQMPQIQWSTDSTIEWELKSEPGTWFVVNVAEFLRIAMEMKSEEEFRALVWNSGQIVHRGTLARMAAKAAKGGGG